MDARLGGRLVLHGGVYMKSEARRDPHQAMVHYVKIMWFEIINSTLSNLLSGSGYARKHLAKIHNNSKGSSKFAE